MKADNGFQDNYSVVVASGTWITDCPSFSPPPSNVLSNNTFSFYRYTHSVGRSCIPLTHLCLLFSD